jgi:anti-sigma B factor antagonist
MLYRVDMQTTVHRDATGCTVLTVTGDVDMEVADDLFAAGIAAIPASGDSSLHVDLSGVTFMDSSGLAALIGIRNTAGDRPAALTLVAPPRQVRRILEMTGLAEGFTIAD